MIIKYDLTEDVLAIAARLQRGGTLVLQYSSPAWNAELTPPDGETLKASGATSPQAIAALGEEIRKS